MVIKKRNEKAEVSVIGVILIIALVIALSGIILAELNGVHIQQKAPMVATEQKIPLLGGCTRNDCQIVKLTHLAGDPVYVKDIQLLVMVLHNGALVKNETCRGFPGTSFTDVVWTGDDIIDRSNTDNKGRMGQLYEKATNHIGIWRPGDYIGFRIKAKNPGVGYNLLKGDAVQVKIIHIPSKLVFVDQTFSVTT